MFSSILIEWLDDVYAMEIETLRMLESHKGDAVNHSEITAQINAYSKKVYLHALHIRYLLEQSGYRVSTVRSNIAFLSGMFKGMSTELTRDKVMRNMTDEYTNAVKKIVLYKCILRGAEEIGSKKIIDLVSTHQQDELEFLKWLNRHLEQIAAETVLHFAKSSQTKNS